MSFEEYLSRRHELVKGHKPLSEVSIEQYLNRFHNLKRRGIVTDEHEITEEILQEIDTQYKNGLKHYQLPLRYYIEYLGYLNEHTDLSLHTDYDVTV